LRAVLRVSLRNVLRAGSEAEMLTALADAAVSDLGAEGAAVVEVLPSGEAKVVEARRLPEAAAGFRAEVDVIDAELGQRLLALCEGRFGCARTLPMMSGGDLFGALVLFWSTGESATVERLSQAEALCDAAGISLGKARQLEELSRSYRELRASREALEHTQKLRALGEMAAGISHDLKNMLNPLSLHLQLLKRIIKRGGSGAEEAVAEMEQVVRRGVETVERLREFSRQTPERRIEMVELDALAHEAAELARPRLASSPSRARGIRIVEQLGAPPPVPARSTELVAALLNLVVNAIDAMTESGQGESVTVSTGRDAEGAWVCVRDDGPGIPEEVRAHIFEPFFTTKGKEGTGLGLAMVYAFAQRHGGSVTVDSTPGKGTAFTLRLPAA
jgi:signal transduction histidine kinase